MRGRGDKGADGGIRTARNDRAPGGIALAVLGALLCASLTACTDPATASAPSGATTVSHGATAPAPPGSPREHPGASDPGAGHGSASGSPAPTATLTVTPSAAPSAPLPSPSRSDSGTGTGGTAPSDDGGEDARVFCSPTALSFVLRLPGAAHGAARPGSDVRAAGDAVLVARNTSGHTCVLRGLPALTVTDDTGRTLFTAERAKPFTKPFALHPGAGGVARVHFVARRGCRGTAVRVAVPGSGTANGVPVVDAQGRPAALSVCGPTVRIGQFTPGFG
ncbi:DUF4232 domain-containing protein [Streptomyces sp. NBC_00083]|uniref:DUF4232 domain-containing protein n=1 Tax=Streptomyces sp. NBC_00083 TaxID=2975647 RepID=UPI00225226C7|nr:DUF4232 domain-containing protein [Streptomyces sp. NBC_00083]MCX5388300.1 DUF4232 domain-containing protein [Streptomyces sp. NBC_00083]